MLKNDKKLSIAFKLVLLSLMLAVQSLSFAHELTHFQSPDAGYCSICSGHSGHDVLVGADISTPAIVRPQRLALWCPLEVHGQDHRPDWQSRAPPATP
jgi:hypothetical protein